MIQVFMSVRTDTVNLIVNVNGNQAQNNLNNLRKSAADIRLEMAGLVKGTAEYAAKANQLKDVNSQMDVLKKSIGLTALSQKELTAELNKLKALRGSVVPFSAEFDSLTKSIGQVENRLYDVRNGTQGFASFLSKLSDGIKEFGTVAAAYLGFQFITSQFQNIIRSAGKLSDQLADLQRVAGFTAAEAKNLNGRLGELDTRTTTEGLRQISIIAGKLGVAKEDIYGFTKAVDHLVVSLGDELGDADQITTQLGKILNVFDGKVTGENISKLGNSFVELANTGAATGGFIADFDQRLSGIAKSAGISLGALSGLGAGLEEMGSKVESSSTAIQKLVISIASNIPAAAKIANVSIADFAKLGVKSFDELFRKDPTEALLRYSQGLVKNKGSFAEVTASLKDAGEEGARTIEIISKLGTNADQLRTRIDLGKKSIEETSAITEAFNLKNQTFGATLDKLGKEFNKLVSSNGVSKFLQGAVEGAIEFIRVISKIPGFIKDNQGAFTLLLAGIILLNGAFVKAAAVSLYDAAAKLINANATRLSALANNIAVASQAAYITITNLLTSRITIATAAQRLWNIAIAGSTGGLGVILILLAAVAAAFSVMATAAGQASLAGKLYADVQKRVVESTTEELNKIEILTKVLQDGNVSYDNKKKALQALIAISPQYLNGLTLENINMKEGKDILDKYIVSLKTKAELEAKSSILTDKLKERNSAFATIKTNPAFAKSSDAEIQEKLKKKEEHSSATKDLVGFGELELDGLDILKLFQNIKEIAILQDDLTKAAKKNIESVVKSGEAVGAIVSNNANTIAALKAQIKSLDDAFENIDITNTKALKSNRSNRAELEAQLQALEGKSSPKQKKDDNEYERLKKEAQKFQDELLKIKQRATIKGEEPEQAEIDAVKLKYTELLTKAKEYYFKHAIGQSQFNADERVIAEAQALELDAIFKKYLKKKFDEGSAKEYDESLLARTEYSGQLKEAAAKDYADGIINRKAYEKELKIIDQDENIDRIRIATDYSSNVKKAAKDVTIFKKAQEKQQTQNILEETELRRANAEADALALAKRGVLTARPGSQDELEAKKELLGLQLQMELNNDKLTYEQKRNLRLQFNKDIEQMDRDHTAQQIEQIMTYVGYFESALTSLNSIINNIENAAFSKEKASNDKKKKSFKDQLDHKLISKEQYDKKTQKINEEQDTKERAMRREQAKREKALNLFSAIVGTAAAVIKTMATVPYPLNIPLAIAQGIAGALQVAVIATTPLPELGLGDWIRTGDKHSDRSGGINAKIERDEAVMSARAMLSNKQYTVTGTTAQITSALNGQAGGANWAGGAVVQMPAWRNERPATINPDLPRILEQGGIVRPMTQSINTDNSKSNLEALLQKNNQLLQEHIDITKNKADKIQAIVSIKDFDKQRALYDQAKKASGFN